jgi:hypothetical protein
MAMLHKTGKLWEVGSRANPFRSRFRSSESGTELAWRYRVVSLHSF